MKYLVYTILIIIAFGFTGCNYLDAVPEKDIQTVESIFEQRKGAEQWRRGLYASANLLFADACRNMSFFGADELVVNEYMKNDATVAGIKISEGLQMAQTPYGDVWASVYNIIRDCNTFLDNIDNVYNMKNTEKRMWEADVKALKAYLYFELVRRYGPIVLVPENLPADADIQTLQLPRMHVDTCFNTIVTLLDEAIEYLPAGNIRESDEFYTFAEEAAYALKARVLLYAASPLFNERPIEPGNELIGYASYDPERWNLAAQAAKALIDEFGPNGKKTLALTTDYRNISTEFYSSTSNPELIFFRPIGKGKGIETANGPLGFSGNAQGYGNTNPTQNLVESFLMKDGKTPGNSTKYEYNEKNDPYRDRDPRLELTVLHHGSSWLNTQLQTNFGGANNPSGAEYSRTSYYISKFMKDYKTKSEYDNEALHLWVMYRYGEVLLNYAEALNEYQSTPSQDVYNAIIALRKRAGIDEDDNYGLGALGAINKTEMRKIIQNERRIEMAFEEQRYWDIRRWRIAEEVFEKPLEGLNIQISGAVTTYYKINVLSTTFNVKRYFYPIPYSEVIKNKNMVQNPNW